MLVWELQKVITEIMNLQYVSVSYHVSVTVNSLFKARMYKSHIALEGIQLSAVCVCLDISQIHLHALLLSSALGQSSAYIQVSD